VTYLASRIQNVGLTSLHYERTLAFYRDLLGLGVHWQSDQACFLRAGAVFLAIVDAAKGEPEFRPTGRGIWLDLYVDDLDVVQNMLEGAGATIRKKWETADGRLLLTEDPDGNLVEIVQAGSTGRPAVEG
jgi:catechol 2,3-dioxygenase-like lactoylglutathione lyase family enzyme